jgi:hypothetical protein
MSQKPPTPTRHKYLEVYIECCKKAERRIRGAFAPDLVLASHQILSGRERAARLHIRDCKTARGMEGYALALRNLRITRSKLVAELEGLKW